MVRNIDLGWQLIMFGALSPVASLLQITQDQTGFISIQNYIFRYFCYYCAIMYLDIQYIKIDIDSNVYQMGMLKSQKMVLNHHSCLLLLTTPSLKNVEMR